MRTSSNRRSIFKIPMLTHRMIVVSGLDKVDDIRRAPEDVLSMMETFPEVLARTDLDSSFRFIIGNLIRVVRTPLTRNIGVRFLDVRDEIITAFNDHIPVRNAWIKVRAYSTMMEIVCRASNRMLVGLPLCAINFYVTFDEMGRDSDYLELNKRFTIDMIKCSYFLNTFPRVLRPYALRNSLIVAKDLERGVRHMSPLVKEHWSKKHNMERIGQIDRFAIHYPIFPKLNDALTWLVEVLDGKECTVREITAWILEINFVSIHTSTITMTHSLYDLAARPEYVHPLREEIEAIVEKEGSVAKMTKLDGFVKETMRLASSAACIMTRKIMKDFTFTDGTTIPAGNFISVPAACINTDPDIYADAGTFDGFRFEKIREEEGSGKSKHSLVSLDLDYLLFGHGRHACPGRFFAAIELKTMLAHIVMNYDVKMADGGGRPENVCLCLIPRLRFYSGNGFECVTTCT
ncbi:cytochrome P450 [Amanita rubescens]|nr:cytochrome P450 [Amanita rubescens]KAF8330127.1 cytochrome P450 [Amanita rubescens]